MMRSLLYTFIIAGITLLNACKKEIGTDGPLDRALIGVWTSGAESWIEGGRIESLFEFRPGNTLEIKRIAVIDDKRVGYLMIARGRYEIHGDTLIPHAFTATYWMNSSKGTYGPENELVPGNFQIPVSLIRFSDRQQKLALPIANFSCPPNASCYAGYRLTRRR